MTPRLRRKAPTTISNKTGMDTSKIAVKAVASIDLSQIAQQQIKRGTEVPLKIASIGA
jgi:hypothetical protein